MKLLQRLHVYVIGDRFHRETVVMEQAAERLREKPMLLHTHNYDKVQISHSVRSYRRSVEAGPNAPLLKRLVKNPQILEKGYFSRVSIPKVQFVEREKPNVGATLKAALHREKKLKKMRPMDLHPPLKREKRPTIDDFLQTKKS